MKIVFLITIILTIYFRPLLPIISYTVNYDDIVTNLCENKNRPEFLCNGFCYIKKSFNKNKSNSSNDKYEKNFTKIYEAIINTNQKISLSCISKFYDSVKIDYYYIIPYDGLIKKIFHPPIYLSNLLSSK